MAAVIPIGTTPQKISGTASKQYLISNDPASVSTVYIGQDSSVSTSNYGIKLSPGSSLTWQEITKEVWAIVATSSANITVTYQAAAAISGQIQALSSSNPVLLQTLVIPFTSGSPLGEVTAYLNDQYVAKYTGLRVTIQTNITTAGGALNNAAGVYLYFRGTQSAITLPTSTTAQPQNDASWSINAASGATGLIPAIQSYDFTVNNLYLTNTYLGYGFGATTPTGTYTVRLFGLTQPLATNKYLNVYGSNDQVKAGVMLSQGFTTGTTNVEIPSMGGNATLSMTTTAATPTSVIIGLYTYVTGTVYQFYSGGYLTPGTLGSGRLDNITLPNAPVRITAIIAGTGTIQINLTQNGI